MTTLLTRSDDQVAPWSVMPGWGVVADLTPPELTEMRRLRVLRKAIAAGLGLIVALCAAVYVFATFQESGAEDSLGSTIAQGDRLTSSGSKFSSVTRIQASTDSINARIAAAMATDVDMSSLITRLRSAVPASMSLSNMSISLSAATGTTAPTDPTASGQHVIGTVTLAGSSQRLANLADYVTALQKIKGVINVLPASNTAGTAGTANWTLTLQVTDALHTHRFDVGSKQSGGK